MSLKKIVLFLCITHWLPAQEKPIILWDLHGVLLDQENPITTTLQYPNLRKVITHLSWPLIKNFILLTFRWHDISSEEYLALARSHNNLYLEELILQIANAQSPMKTMNSLVDELALLEYPQHIGSNIGPTSFFKLINPQLYPKLAPLFAKLDIPSSQISYFTNSGIIKKPNTRYFKEYLSKNNIDVSKRPVIFIDDNKTNVIAAKSLGFDGIHFKHPYQLRNELLLRGIPVAKPPYSFSNQRHVHHLYNPCLFWRPIA